MQLSPQLINDIAGLDESNAWQRIVQEVLDICRQPMDIAHIVRDISLRERKVGIIDHLISSTAWELWNAFPLQVETNSGALVKWWRESDNAKAILILDGLSLRELPWLLQGAEAKGYTIQKTGALASEIPAETNEFAKALGFSSRGSLTNNGAGLSHFFPRAKTECVHMPWKDAANLIDAHTHWIFWHQWPDISIHQGSGQGQGLETFSKDCAEILTSDDFWEFVRRLTQGRSLIITSDHGYAASGLFTDADDEAGLFLKTELKSGRSVVGDGAIGPFIPPVMMRHENSHGVHRLAVGRWKWKSQGGYPTLSHGGLSLLEVLSPWVELAPRSGL